MADLRVPDRVRLERLPPHAWGVIGVVILSLVYAFLEVTLVRPYLWPAGAGAAVASDPASRLPVIARPPDVRQHVGQAIVVRAVVPGSPAATRGIEPGTEILAIGSEAGTVDLRPSTRTSLAREVEVWRAQYRLGVRDPVSWTLKEGSGQTTVMIGRYSAMTIRTSGWARAHLGMMMQVVVFIGAALVLLLMRSHDLTAGLCVLALVLSAVGSGGPLLGAETAIPFGRVLTVFSWIASPLAFPVIALAMLYFPSRSPLIVRHPWVQAIPFLVAAPMIGPSSMTALYLAGVDGARDLAVWDATHPSIYAASFAGALGINLLAVAEGVYRYRFNHDANERRRIRMAVYTAVPGVAAFAIKDGAPIVAMLAGADAPTYPTAVLVMLQTLVLLPAFGLSYAVGVSHVLGPRLVLRRSVQYALASKTLSVVAVVPAIALVLSLVRDRGRTIGEIFMSRAGLYLVLIAILIAALRYRERARQWLDHRFFRDEYDARKILLSLASRVRFETDPADLAAMVVSQIDEALHPEAVAILVSGLEEGRLVPVTVLHGSADSLALDGGLGGMLRWSDAPLDILLNDPRSPVRRLPPEEREWLHCTGAALLVPVVAQDGGLVAVIVLGERRSEEAYTDEDRELLGSIAAQMGLGFDVARLRRRAATRSDLETDTARLVAQVQAPMNECPRCGRCEEPDTVACPNDGAPMKPAAGVPRTVDNKYRIEQLIGRGGMGAVYRARDMRLDRMVALKVVRAELLSDPESRLRFRREAQIVARLQHPSIVAVYDYGTLLDGGAYLVMELVRGEDLRRVLQREGRMDPERVVRILDAVCAAIEAAHREGVLHRDLKPENILLPTGSGSADAKVLDFGVAKVIDSEDGPPTGADSPTLMTAPGIIIGTPAYMAPEQFNFGELDARTDVFSLGVIAYEMVSGELPFGRGTLTEVVLAQARGVPPMPRGSAAPELERAIRSALETDPDRRPASAQAFAHLVGSAVET
jgi:tRNA A-37 threonylcarbamoyl transferase component Bud32